MPQPLNILDQDPFFFNKSQNVYRDSSSKWLDTPTLTIIDQWTLSVPPLTATSPGHRRRPSSISQPIETQDVSVKATHPICTGRNRWSQVWLGGIVSLSMMESSVVVIKVFQESLFPRSGDGEVDGGAKHARAEACSYKLMSRLQGEYHYSIGDILRLIQLDI